MRARPRFTYANVVSSLALVIAMSTGGAYAASQITTSQIADGAVTTRKLHSDSVRSSKIDDGAVTRNKLDGEAVSSSKLAPGAVTATRLGSNAVTGAKVADGTLGTNDVGETLTGADVEDGTLSGDDITNNSVGLTDLHYDARRPTAYALVVNGQVSDAMPSHALTSEMITQAEDETETPIPGVYCLEGLPFQFVLAAQATPSLYFGSPSVPHVSIGSSSYCPNGTDIEVVVYTFAGGNWQTYSSSFHIAIWGV